MSVMSHIVNIFVKKVGQSVILGEFGKLPESTQIAIVQYGATQMCNDKHASITKGGETPFKGTESEFVKAVMTECHEWVSRAKAGTLGVRASVDLDAAFRAKLLASGYTEAQVVDILAGPKAKKAA